MKLVYVLATILVALMYLGYVIVAFKASAALGIIVLLVIGPIMVILSLALYRVCLEFFMEVIRMSDDIHRRLPQEQPRY